MIIISTDKTIKYILIFIYKNLLDSFWFLISFAEDKMKIETRYTSISNILLLVRFDQAVNVK